MENNKIVTVILLILVAICGYILISNIFGGDPSNDGKLDNNINAIDLNLEWFKTHIMILQDSVMSKMFENVADKELGDTSIEDEYTGITTKEKITGENINKQLGNSVEVYKFSSTALKTLGINEDIDISQFCLDAQGNVYHIKGVVAEVKGVKTVLYNAKLQVTKDIPKTAIDISKYK